MIKGITADSHESKVKFLRTNWVNHLNVYIYTLNLLGKSKYISIHPISYQSENVIILRVASRKFHCTS